MDATLLVQYKALSAPTLTLPVTLFQPFDYFLNFYWNKCLYDAIWDLKREREKKFGRRWDRTTGRSRQKRHDLWFTTCATGCLVQSAVSNLFPNQWRCLKLYLPLPVCLNCRCVFWLVILFSNLSLCFLTCYNVFGIVVVFSELLFCFLYLHLRL